MAQIDNVKVAKNIIFSGISESTSALLFLVMVLAARFLGDADFGKYCFTLSFVNIFQLFVDWGLTYASTIEISRDRSKGKFYLGNILGFQTASSVMLTLVITISAIVISFFIKIPNAMLWLIYLQMFTMFARAYKLTFRWFFKGFERFDLEALTLIIERGAVLLVGTYVLVKGYGLFGFVTAFLVVRIIDVFTTYFITRIKVIPAVPVFNTHLWQSLIKKGFPFVAGSTLIFIALQIDTVILGFMRTAQEVGWYNVPYRIIEGLFVVPTIISCALLPTMSQAHTISKEMVSGIYARAAKYMMLLSLPIITTSLISAKKIVPFIFGASYLESIPIFMILMPCVFFIFLSSLGTILMASVDKQKNVIKLALIYLGVNLALNSIIIKIYGAKGAAIVKIISEALFFLLINIHLNKTGYKIKWVSLTAKPIIACLLLAVIQIFIFKLNLFMFLALTPLIYFCLLFLTRNFDSAEKEVVKNLLNKTLLLFKPKNSQIKS